MQLVEQIGKGTEEKTHTVPAGLADWLLRAFSRMAAGSWSRRIPMKQRELKLLETLSLGGRRQLILVSCAGKHFLVGAGADSIASVIPLSSHTVDRTDCGATKLAEPWA